jgi:D-arginine dehydrogenase
MTHDFLIIGGGIAGVSAAARLSELGTVVLLEAEDVLAHHASSRSAALYEPRYGAPAVVGLSMASGDYFRSVPGVLSPRGLMLVAKADAQEAFEHDLKAMEFDRFPSRKRGPSCRS